MLFAFQMLVLVTVIHSVPFAEDCLTKELFISFATVGLSARALWWDCGFASPFVE